VKGGIPALVLLAAACGGPPPPPPHEPNAPGPPPAADSLALRAPDGTEVWFSYARGDTSVAGVPCVERTLEIRAGGRRIGVPLLYTGAAPVLVDDTAFRADIWVRCAPTERYLISLRTGIPTAEKRR
jgi:hypothetical protein